MAFEDLKESIVNQFQQIGDKITNSSLFVKLNERYENFNLAQQRLIKVAGFILLLGLALYFPQDYFFSSFDSEREFETKRKLIKNIIKTERDITALPDLPRPLPADSVKSNIESQLKEMNFLPEQIKLVRVNNQPTSSIIPANKIQYGIDVTVNKINVKQLTNLGSKLQIIHPAVKLKDIIVTLNREDARYLNAEIKMVALNIPEYHAPEPPPPENPKKKGKKANKKDEEQ